MKNIFSRPKRRVPEPHPLKGHAGGNPLFSGPEENLSKFRRTILFWTGTIFLCAALGFALYGTWFRLTDIQVRGTRELNADSIRRVTEEYLDQPFWLIIPRRTSWAVSAGDISRHVRRKIQERLSVEEVRTTKKYPHRLEVTVVERTPLFTWTNGSAWGPIDRQGVIIASTPTPPTDFATLPELKDGLNLPFGVNTVVVKPEVMAALSQVRQWADTLQLDIESFEIPKPACPIVTSPVPGVNTNQNVPLNVNVATNASVTNEPLEAPQTNLNVPEVVLEPTCDLAVLKLSSPELHIQLQQGPKVLIDRHQDIRQAMNSVQRLLADPKNARATYFDVRFGERVYIR